MRKTAFSGGALLLAASTLACQQTPANLIVEEAAVSADAVDMTIHFSTKSYDDVVPKDGTVTVAVKDVVLTSNVFDDDKNKQEVCTATAPASAGTAVAGTKNLHFHLAAKCPAVGPKTSRDFVVTFAPAKGSTIIAGKPLERGERPKAAPPADRREMFKKALAEIPAPGANVADRKCPVEGVYGADRKDRDAVGRYRLYSWDDAASSLGVAGTRKLCPNVLDDVSLALKDSTPLAAVVRLETCVQPRADAATKTFTRGTASGVLAVIDLRDGAVLCLGKMTAQTEAVVKVDTTSTDPEADIRRSFSGSIRDAAITRLHTLSPYLGLGEKDQDPTGF